MELHELSPLVEALLFAADEPLTPHALSKAVGEDGVTPTEVRRVLEALAENYDIQPRGFQLVKLGNGYQVMTRDRYAPWVESMVTGKRRMRLSRAALETGAVIAYKQPITRIGIERIRGVDVGGVLHTLMERNLVMIKGRDPGPGRPLLYGTTQAFLDYFGLARLGDLPRLDEIAAMSKIETTALWDDVELARFGKHGVEGEAVPAPDAEPGSEFEDEEEEPADEAASDSPEDVALAPEEEREELREVADELAAHALEESSDDDLPADAAEEQAEAHPGESV